MTTDDDIKTMADVMVRLTPLAETLDRCAGSGEALLARALQDLLAHLVESETFPDSAEHQAARAILEPPQWAITFWSTKTGKPMEIFIDLGVFDTQERAERMARAIFPLIDRVSRWTVERVL